MISETLPGSYSLITMPDGSQKMVAKVRNEKGGFDWVFVEDRIKAQADFEARFPADETRPQDWEAKQTNTLTPRSNLENLVNVKDPCTKNHINAHLVSIFGAPERILEEGAGSERIAKIREDRRHLATCLELMKICKDEQWLRVREMLLSNS